VLCPRSMPSTKRFIRSPSNRAGIVTQESPKAACFYTARVKNGPKADVRVESDPPSITDIRRAPRHVAEVPLAAVSRCSELSYETDNGRSEGCGRKAKRRGDTLHTAHDAPLEMPDRSRAEPLHLHAAGAQTGAARARDDRPARGEGAEA
jgi:uncharacterized protein (DUF3084 family)